MSEINWSVELRKIEREYDKLPPLPPVTPKPLPRSRTQLRLQKIQEIVAKGQFDERLEIIGIWARLVLVAALGTSLFWWPYGHSCGFSLAAFLAAQVMVIVGGLSVATLTWRARLVWPFGGSVLFVVIAWTVLAVHTLPRLGYPAAPAVSGGWVCQDSR